MKKAHKDRSMVRPQQVNKDTYSTSLTENNYRLAKTFQFLKFDKNIENYHTELQYN